jgi:DNA-binding IclR family transcriptional regulator
VTNWVGRRVPHHVAANGKVFMAFGAAPVPARLERFTERTITKRTELEAELERVRAQGYATVVDELEIGLAALAAPVRNAEDEVVAALSISGPTIRFNAERRAELAPLLVDQAHILSSKLGHEQAA